MVLQGAFSVLRWLIADVVVGCGVTTCHPDRVELRALNQDLGSVLSQVSVI